MATPDPDARLQKATAIFVKQASISEVSRKIASAVDESLSKQQKEFFLRQQLQAIQRELQALRKESGNTRTDDSGKATSGSELDDDEQAEADDLADLKRRIEAMAVGSEERKMAVREWRRLKRIPQGSVENGVVRTYVSPSTVSSLLYLTVTQLEWLTSVPWPNSAPLSPSSSNSLISPSSSSTSLATTIDLKDRSFLANARAQLDADHFGLEKIKKRLIEYLAVVRLKEMNAEKERMKEDSETAAQHQQQQSPQQRIEGTNNDEGKTSAESKELVLYEKDKSQSPKIPVTPSLPVVKRRKPIRGPILLYVLSPSQSKPI